VADLLLNGGRKLVVRALRRGEHPQVHLRSEQPRISVGLRLVHPAWLAVGAAGVELNHNELRAHQAEAHGRSVGAERDDVGNVARRIASRHTDLGLEADHEAGAEEVDQVLVRGRIRTVGNGERVRSVGLLLQRLIVDLDRVALAVGDVTDVHNGHRSRCQKSFHPRVDAFLSGRHNKVIAVLSSRQIGLRRGLVPFPHFHRLNTSINSPDGTAQNKPVNL